MNIDDLNKIQAESKRHDKKRELLNDAEKSVARYRKSDRTLCGIFNAISDSNNYGHLELVKKHFSEVLNEQKHELLRLVELRLCAEAREQRIKAAQKSCIVTASILPIDIGEPNV